MTYVQTQPTATGNFKDAIFQAHTQYANKVWTPDGQYRWQDGMLVGQYRGVMMHCIAYLQTQQEQATELANRIIISNYDDSPCPFGCNLAIEILQKHEPQLTSKARDLLIKYLKTNLSFMSSNDMQCHGYNDNHPHKSAHAMICAGEWLGQKHFVQMGLNRLEQSITTFSRNDYPSEYNSPNYQPVSLKPLAELAEMTQDQSARQMATWLEHYHWNDLAHHFDARVGLPTGPFSRGYAGDYLGRINHTVMLLAGLFPERFDFDLIDEFYARQRDSKLIAAANKKTLPFYLSHLVWFLSSEYHPQQQTIDLLFADKSGQSFTGHIESGTASIPCPLENGPSNHVVGPRQGNITNYFGKHFNLGTAQYSWLDGRQTHGMIACVHHQAKASPDAAAYYYARMFYNDEASCINGQIDQSCFNDRGEYRSVQHQNAAMVFYNPLPLQDEIKNIGTGIFRPIDLNVPDQIYVGDTCINDCNFITHELVVYCI